MMALWTRWMVKKRAERRERRGERRSTASAVRRPSHVWVHVIVSVPVSSAPHMLSRALLASARALASSEQSVPPQLALQLQAAVHCGLVTGHEGIWLPEVSLYTHTPCPEQITESLSSAAEGHATFGATHTRGGVESHRPYRQSVFSSHLEPTSPLEDFCEKHGALESPTMPLNPGRQLPQVFGDVTHCARLSSAQ